MLKKYLMVFLTSMVPLIELRGSIVMAVGMDLPYIPALVVCVLGNMLPVPVIYFFARKVLVWGANLETLNIFGRKVTFRFINKIFRVFLEKGERAGEKFLIVIVVA